MSTRTLARSLAATAAAGALLLAAACGSSSSPSPGGSPGTFHGAELTSPLTMPAGTFSATTGDTSYDLAAQLTGKVTLVFFGYTNCPDECPTTMALIGAALRSLPPEVGKDVQVDFVTSDPHRDTTTQMSTWLANFDDGDANPFIGLTTGDAQSVDAFGAKLGVPLEAPTVTTGDYDVTHGTQIFGFGKDAKANVVWLPGVTTEQLAADVTTLVDQKA